MAIPLNGAKPNVTAALQTHTSTQSDWWQQIDNAVAAAAQHLQDQASNNAQSSAEPGNTPSPGNGTPS